MKAEETLQYMADFYSDIFPTRKHALNHLFCTIGNGYEWVKGELVDKSDSIKKRYKLVQKIEKAEFIHEEDWWEHYNMLKSIQEKTGKPVSKSMEFRYYFKWYPLSREYSYLFNYPKNIASDWMALLNECRSLLIADEIDLEKVGN